METPLNLMGRTFLDAEKKCCNCINRKNPQNDCKEDAAKIFFGAQTKNILPEEIKGRNFGNYCPHFVSTT